MKYPLKFIKRIACCLLAVAIVLNLIWNSITCLNVDPACDYITSHALEESHGRAAWHVLGALNAGGKDMILVPAWAYKYYLYISDFDYVEDYMNYVPEKGDIVVFPMTWKHPLGHIAFWNGKQWVSDYKQKSIYIDKDYKGVEYIVYRNVFK